MEVAVIGALNIDICGAANVPFGSGDSLPGEVSLSLGGAGFNIARSAAALGADCAFFSVLGEDAHARDIRAEAETWGLDLSGCRWEQAANSRNLMILDCHGSLTAAVNDMTLTRRMDSLFAKTAGRQMAEARVAVAEANLPAEALFRLTEHLGDALLVADSVSAAKCMRLERILPRIHSLRTTLPEAVKLTGYAGPERCATALLKKGVTRVLIALGPEGLLIAQGEEMLRLPALSPAAANHRGAGEAMTAALAVALLRGLDLDTAGKLAAAAAAITARSSESVSPELGRLKDIAGGKHT